MKRLKNAEVYDLDVASVGVWGEKSNSPNHLVKRRGKKAPAKTDNIELKADIRAKTEPQRMMIQSYLEGLNIVAYGSAGTGKTYVACYLALKDLLEKKKQKIVIVRSAVPTRDLGHLPGTLEEKTQIYNLPYKEAINDLCGSGTAWEVLTKKKMVEFISTSYIRGITLNDCVVIIDEFQNCDSGEIESVLTRLGENSQVIICGDTRQCDLSRKREKTCFDWVLNVTRRMPSWFDNVEFRKEDIVRSGFCKALIMAIEDVNY